jgi:hypothetical protein
MNKVARSGPAATGTIEKTQLKGLSFVRSLLLIIFYVSDRLLSSLNSGNKSIVSDTGGLLAPLDYSFQVLLTAIS